MSYPGDPAGGQQPSQYPSYPGSGSGGYPPPPGGGGYGPPPGGGGYGAPPPQQEPAGPYTPAGQPGYSPEPTSGYGGYGGYDPNTPPVSSPPISGPSYPGPAMAQPYSGPPSSGGPMGPTSGPGGPMGPPTLLGPPTAAPRRSPITMVLAALMVLFLLTTSVMAVLFVTRNSAYNDEKKTVAARDSNIQGLNSEIEKLKADVKRVEGELDAAKRDLGGAQGQADELKRQKQVISKCLTLLGEAGEASRAGDQTKANAKLKEADPVCDEAGRYLD